jgi:hypothetical protein
VSKERAKPRSQTAVLNKFVNMYSSFAQKSHTKSGKLPLFCGWVIRLDFQYQSCDGRAIFTLRRRVRVCKI